MCLDIDLFFAGRVWLMYVRRTSDRTDRYRLLNRRIRMSRSRRDRRALFLRHKAFQLLLSSLSKFRWAARLSPNAHYEEGLCYCCETFAPTVGSVEIFDDSGH
jgi:hypothetical protein